MKAVSIVLALATLAFAGDTHVRCGPTSDEVNVWFAPDSSQVVEKLTCGEPVTVLSKASKGFVKVTTRSNREGYVGEWYVGTDGSQGKEGKKPDSSKGSMDDSDVAVRLSAYGYQAAIQIRDALTDPTSFTLLRVIAITKQEKNGMIKFRGCISYVGSNVYGGRLQRWGNYSVDKDHRVRAGVGGQYSSCEIGKSEDSKDVTTEVQDLLSR